MNPEQAQTTTLVDDIYIPGLTNPSLFQELPSLNGFQRLVPQDLAHQIYQEQLAQRSRSSSSSSPSQLVESCSWRALAILSRHQIVGADPSHTASILQAWSYRFMSLYQLRQPRMIVREMLGLFSTIGQTLPLTDILLDLSPATLPSFKNSQKKALPDIIPFPILVLRARLPVLLAPHQQIAVITTSDGLFELLEGCKRMSDYYDHSSQDVEEKTVQKALWRKRIKEIVGLLASLFSGHGSQSDGVFEALGGGATRGGSRIYLPDRLLSVGLVQSLVEEADGEPRGEWRKWVEMETRLWLEMGKLESADRLLETLGPTHPLGLVRAVIAGQSPEAPDRFLPLVHSSLAHKGPPDISLINNFAIALLYSGNLSQGFPLMQTLMSKLTPIPDASAGGDSAEAQEIGHERHERSDQWSRANGSLNGLMLNYATLIELASGSDSEQIKKDFLTRLLQSSFSSDTTQNQNQIEFPVHRVADLVSLNCFKFPASSFQSA